MGEWNQNGCGSPEAIARAFSFCEEHNGNAVNITSKIALEDALVYHLSTCTIASQVSRRSLLSRTDAISYILVQYMKFLY
jgi:hypothetical protein